MTRRWEFAIDPNAPRHARRALSSALPPTVPRIEDILLATSELVSNAVLHSEGGGVLVLEVRSDGSSTRVEVEDPGPGFVPSRLTEPEPFATSGFGLPIVDRLADRWGVSPTPPTRVWFVMER